MHGQAAEQGDEPDEARHRSLAGYPQCSTDSDGPVSCASTRAGGESQARHQFCRWLSDTSRLLVSSRFADSGRSTPSVPRCSSWDNGSAYFLDGPSDVIVGRSPWSRRLRLSAATSSPRRGKQGAVLTGELSNDALKPTKGAVDGARVASLRAAPHELR
jgi:hypothetical protein